MTDNSLELLAAGIVAASAIIGAYLLDLPGSVWIILAGLGVTALIIYLVWDEKMLERLANEHNTQAFQTSAEPFDDIDELWEALQEWYGQDPRNGELVWQRGVTKFNTTVPKSVDGKFKFLGMLTPTKKLNKKIFIGVEMTTRSLLTWDEEGDVDSSKLCGNIELVEDIRSSSNVSADRVRQQIMSSRVAGLGGGANAANLMGLNANGQGQQTQVLEEDSSEEGDSENE